MWIEGYRVKPSVGMSGYRWEWTVDGATYQALSDQRMGCVMLAQRELVKLMAADHGIVLEEAEDRHSTDAVVLRTIDIEKSVTQPGYRVFVESGSYSFTAYMDPTIESFLAVWSACMKFFAAKYGMVYLYDEVARNVDAAHEQGFETKGTA